MFTNRENIMMIQNFDTIEEAKKNICYFDGSECSEKVVFEN